MWIDDEINQIVAVMYFAFTTMSTVGFGDFHPTNSYERVLGVLIFMFGNAAFTLVIGDIIDMIGVMKNYFSHKQVDDSNLYTFFCTIERFNKRV